MHRHKVKLLLWFVTVLSVLALVVALALADSPGVTLTVVKAGEGTGTVTSDPPGISCGAVCEATYGYALRSGMLGTGVPVTLTAIPDEGSVFSVWGQDCQCGGKTPANGVGFGPGTGPCTITMNENRICTATFGLPVGGIAVPVNKLGLLAPWLGMAALASLATLTVALVRRRGG